MLLLIFGVLVGFVMGLTGAGGGILATPLLIFSLGIGLNEAKPVALLAVAISASVGAWSGFRHGLVRYRAAFLMAFVGVPFSSLGIYCSQLVSANTLGLAFACIMFWVAIRQIFFVQKEGLESLHAVCHLNTKTGRLDWSWLTALMMGTIGAVTGLLTGLLGVGGGFVMVPLLRLVTDLTMHSVVATTLFVVALISSASFIGVLAKGTTLSLSIALPFVIAATLGMLLGRRVINKVPVRWVHTSFGMLVLLVGVALAIRSWPV